MDSSFVTIGETLTVKEAINAALPYLLDANQQLFEIDSDSHPRLIHLRVTRSNGQSPWSCTLQNSKLEDIARIYVHEQEEFDPPRVVDGDDKVVGPRDPSNFLPKPPFPNLGKIYIKGNLNSWDDVEDFVGFGMSTWMLDKTLSTSPYPPTSHDYANWLQLKGEQRYRTHQLAEIGTYIIPICYHRTTSKGFESIQVLRSDASFWPMPIHQVWSMQDNWQDFWSGPAADAPNFDPNSPANWPSPKQSPVSDFGNP